MLWNISRENTPMPFEVAYYLSLDEKYIEELSKECDKDELQSIPKTNAQ